MNNFLRTLLITYLGAVVTLGTPQASEWTYSGDTGPHNWSKLEKEFSACGLIKNQSPVDISKTYNSENSPIKFIYNHASKRYRYTDNQLKILFTNGSFSVGGESYHLIELHFHTPSEHQISGKTFPLEAHFKNIDKDGNIAFISVLFIKGRENASLKAFLNNRPERSHRLQSGSFNYLTASKLLPKTKTYYRINGSLTTPPCTEGVLWLVMQHQVTVSAEQIRQLEGLLRAPNNRPIQPLNARIITR